VVEAGPVTLRVSGTHFAVRRGTDATTVVVQRGVVDVEVGDRHVLVHAGERWPPSMSAVLR
jgi:ferric-dicitrate binding protein FerR (iron transport regulator)